MQNADTTRTGRPKLAVLGASGALGGRVCALAADLLQADLVLCGRKEHLLDSLSQKIPGQSSVLAFDLASPQPEALASLAECDMLLNCCGPSWRTAAPAAKLSLGLKAHYVDPGGYTLAMGVLTPHNEELARQGRSCIIGAGWMPGLAELAARHLIEATRTRYGEKVRELDVCFGARDHWPRSSVSDMIWHLFELPHSLGCFDRGQWKKARPWNMGARVNLAPFGGRERVAWVYNEPFALLAQEFPEMRLRAGLMFVGPLTQTVVGLSRLLLNKRRDLAERLLQKAIARDADKHGTAGLVVCQARSDSNRRLFFAARGRDNMGITALAAVLAAKHALDGSARRGVAYFDQALPPGPVFSSLSDEIGGAGISISEIFLPGCRVKSCGLPGPRREWLPQPSAGAVGNRISS